MKNTGLATVEIDESTGLPVETPIDITKEPYFTKTPPILGETWWMRLRHESKGTILVFARMGQMAKPPKKGEKEWRVYASQEKLAAVCGVDVDTVRRAWNRLEVVGLLKKDKGTGVPGITSQFSIFGLGFPERTSPQR